MAFKWTFDLRNSDPVFVEKGGRSYEARLVGARGTWDSMQRKIVELYTVDYTGSVPFPNEEVTVERIRRAGVADVIQMVKKGELTQDIYDLSTQAAIDEFVAAHNKWRAEVGVPPVTWDPQLAREAQEWADKLLRLDVMKHSTYEERHGTGENIFWASSPHTPAHVVDSWGNEKQYYDYGGNCCSLVCGHYTQVVWKETQRIGGGVARDEDDVYWVCRYDPAGNMNGRRPY
ncbi:MAG: CAP domain-containing protein [Candidatus Electrothrix sp. YB6]